MSNARKLQTEIDRVMKKVDEGVGLFDEIWEKVYAAEQQNQKEKYEMDLKKEIKKLQRLRDQIKTWIGSSDVKDKEPLIEARKLIETKMEQFKICEKETKTKTYSKEGLAREEKLDPAEEAKLNTTSWIGDYIHNLNQLVEDREVEIERLSSGKGKKTNKHIIDEYNGYVANHKFHVNKLEGIMRLVNNDRLDVEVVDNIKEDLDYYIDSYEDDDYQQAYDEEFFYESLGLDGLDVVNVDRVTQVAVPTKKVTNDDAASSSSKGSKENKKAKKSSLSSVIPLTIGRARASSSGKDKDTAKEVEKSTPSKIGRATATASTSTSSAPAVPTARAPAAPPHSGASMAAILKRETEQQEKERQKLLREQQARQQQEQLRQQQLRQQQEAQLRQQEALRQQQQEAQLRQQEAMRQQQQAHAAQQQAQQEAAAKQQQKAAAAQLQAAAQQQQQAAEQKAAQKLQNVQQQLQAAAQAGASSSAVHQAAAQQAGALDILSQGLGGLQLGPGGAGPASAPGVDRPSTSDGTSAPGVAGAPPQLGANATGAAAVSLNQAAAAAAVATNSFSDATGSSYLTALNESFANMPHNVDNERSRQYTPQNPYPTPSSYPSTPSSIFDNPAVFEKLGTDCLFFIFYYSQGTYQQYLAARELKKQSWRFHKKYMTWFQRHEEPKVTTDEYELGTYVYFDYETGWCTRIKTDFRFEYSFLEDSLQ